MSAPVVFPRRQKLFAGGDDSLNTTRSSFLNKVQSGNETAWNEFYQRYTNMIRKVGRDHQLTEEECDDLMIDVMVIFWKKMEYFTYDHNQGKFRNYLSSIADFAAMKIFNRRRNRNRRDNLPVPEYPEYINAEEMAEWQNFLLDLALNDLKENLSTENYNIFYMSFIQRRPVSEISAMTGKTENCIYVIRHRCLKKLKKILLSYRGREEAELLRNSKRKNRESLLL